MPNDRKRKAPKPRTPMTKRQLSRYEREQQLTRIVLGVAALVVVVIIAITGVSFWREGHRGDDIVATAFGTSITYEQYAKVLGYNEYSLNVTLSYFQNIASQPDPTDENEKAQAQVYKQYAAQQVQQYQYELQTVSYDVLDSMISSAAIKNEAAKRGITVSAEEVDQYILEQYGPTQTTDSSDASATGTSATPAATPGAAATPTNTAVPTATPVPAGTATPGASALQQAKDNLSTVLTQQIKVLTVDEYRAWIAEPSVLRTKLSKAMAAEVPTTAEQVDVKHILFAEADKDKAQATLDQLKAGADFDALAKELSTDTATKDKGGDLGWFPKGSTVSEFENAAFAVQPGEIYPELVHTDYGYHIIKGVGHEANRVIDADMLTSLQEQEFTTWLQAQVSDATNVKVLLDSAGSQWVSSYISEKLPVLSQQ